MDYESMTSSSDDESSVHELNIKCIGLLTAVHYEEKNDVKSYLLQGVDVNMKGFYEETALHIAAKNGFLDILKILFQHGASTINSFTDLSYRSVLSDEFLYCCGYYPPTERNDDNTSVPDYTPLHLATLNKNASIVKFLLEHGANIDAQDKDGKTALFIAVEQGYSKIVDLILLHRPEVNNNSSRDKNALEMAVLSHNDNVKIIHHLYDYGFRIDPDCNNSTKVINRVIEKGAIKILEDLIKRDANINFKDSKNGGFSPLHSAVVKKDEKICKVLIENKAEINAKDNRGNSPIFYAIENGNIEICKLLLNNGANLGDNIIKAFNTAVENNYLRIMELILQYDVNFNVNVTDDAGRTPLHCIVSYDNNCNLKEKIIELLLKKGADVNCRSKKGITVLYTAAKKGFNGIVRILLEYNADVNALESDGSSALHAATIGGHLESVDLLLKSSCDVNIKNELGSTPLHVAVENNHVKICELLLKFGANYELKYDNGCTILHLACEKRFEEIVKVILESVCFNIFKNCCISIDSFDNFCKSGVTEISNTYIDFINAANDDSLTSLMIGVQKNSISIVKDLLYFGASVEPCDRRHETALHIAAGLGHYDLMYILLEFGSDINALSIFDHTPYVCTYRNNEWPSIEISINVLYCHSVKLYVAGLYHLCHQFCDRLHEDLSVAEYEDALSIFVHSCQKELSAMKQHFVLKDISFHDILTLKNVDQFLVPARNKKFVESFYSFDCKKLFPIYSDVLFYLLRSIVKRKNILQECVMWLDSVGNCSFSILPKVCIENILAYLSNKTLITIIETCRPRY